RVLAILDLVLVDPGDAVEDLLPLARVGHEVALLLVDPEEVLEAPGLAIEPLERADRRDVLAVGVVDGAELGERVVDPLHLVEEQAPEPEPQAHLEVAIVRLRLLNRRLVRRDQLLPAPGDARGALDVVDAPIVAGRDLERGEVALERLLRLLELRLVETGDLA